jgi:hypothetical protein
LGATATNWTGTSALGRTDGATSGKGTGYAINVPVGAWNFGYQASKNTENETKANEVFARYSLSKRTEIYSYMGKTSGVKAVAAGSFPSTADNKLIMGTMPANPTVTALGVRHTF